MSQFLVNTTGETLAAQGWDKAAPYDSNRIPLIVDTIQGGLALDKMGTSIPHPFARLFVFDTAFNEVNKAGHQKTDTSYAKLTSECLDLLEFIYQFGNKITVKVWDNNDLNLLKASPIQGHQNMYEAFSKAFANLSFKDATGTPHSVGAIYLFFYNGKLLGGTSPYTMVFTSPNIRKYLKEINANGFKGLAGAPLFPDYKLDSTIATPLNKRSAEFQEFLSKFYVSYQNIMDQTSLGRYIYKNAQGSSIINQTWTKINDNPKYTDQDFLNDYAHLQFSLDGGINKLDVNILKDTDSTATNFIPVGYRKQQNTNQKIGSGNGASGTDIISDDYEIVPKVPQTDGKILPLVLKEGGIAGASLISGRPIEDRINLSTSESDIYKRTLPTGMNLEYPYVYVDDFIAGKLIEMPYKLNATGFYTLECDGKFFLMPVKQLFFKFFRPADLDRMISIRRSANGYIISLNVPIKYNSRSIELVSEITDIVNLNDGGHFLGVALFPSYKVLNNAALNRYRMMVNDEECNATFTFFDGFEKLDDTVVSEKAQQNGTMKYFNIKKEFDFIEVEIGDAKALIVPRFKEVTLNSAANIAVGIDFGTSNSYICIKDSGNVDTLSIDEAHQQTLTLNEPALSKGNKDVSYQESMSPYGMDDFYNAFMREFVPHLIGANNSVASFPFPTVICEKSSFASNANSAELFSDVSVGFNSVNESTQTQLYHYVSNIKWLLKNSNAANLLANEKRVKAFIYEIAWLVKNYIMLHNPTQTFTVFITFPTAMKRAEKRQIVKMWTTAFDELLGSGCVTIVADITESAAPFLYILGNEGAIATNYVNIDIGGGTTDIVYIDHAKKIMFADSSSFAGNDLWGDGVPKNTRQLINGFLAEIDSLVSNGHISLNDTERQKFDQQKQLAETSADVMSYIFRNENIFSPASFLTKKKNLRAAMFTHFAAICYHIAKTMKAKEMDASNLVIRFSGLGSKYIDMILPETEDKADIISAMFKAMGLTVGKIKVQSLGVSPKEVTARGSVIANDERVRNLLNNYTEDGGKPEVIALNFGSIAPVSYGDISKNQHKVEEEYLDFVDKTTTGSFYRYIREEFDVVFTSSFIEALKDHSKMGVGFQKMSEHDFEDAENPVTESAFFWPLKEALVHASNI